MSAIPSSAPAISSAAPPISSVAPTEIDASCRVPILVLFVCAAAWLVTASVFAFLTSLKLHMPQLLADCPWFTYGRLQPMQMNALLYGFAAQAALGASLWLIARLGRTRLVQPGFVVVGALLWNVGVKLGTFGIQIGDSTGFEWLEMPGYASAILFVGYTIMAVCGLLTFHQRREPTLYVSQWFLLAALFWFPWIYSTANLLLVFFPVRGVLQASINWWYIGSLSGIWIGFSGLAAIFYFVPKLTGRPLHSHALAMLAFWTLALFGGWGGIHYGAPLPAWIPSLSTVFTVLTLIPLLAIAINWYHTLAGASGKESLALRFVLFGAAMYLLAGVLGILDSLPQVSQTTQFTFFTTARTQLFLYGFFSMTLFGSIYYIVPQLTGSEWPSTKWANRHFTLAAWGIRLYVASLVIGGLYQGRALNNADKSFLDALSIGLVFFRVSTIGDLLMLAGNALLALNLAVWLVRACRACCVPAIMAAAKSELEVAR